VNVARDGTIGSLPVYSSGAPDGFNFEGWYAGDSKYDVSAVISETITAVRFK
jgi:hypothetical protein